jgi:MtN3 and saliva related transmembrane protein
MKFSFIDRNVSTTMNVFLVIANIINLFYNIPQMVKTYKRKSTKDFSTTFLVLRILGNLIWIGYAIEVSSLLMLINNIVTVLSSIFIGYYKVLEIIKDYRNKKEEILPLDNLDDNNLTDNKILNLDEINTKPYDNDLYDVNIDDNDNDNDKHKLI